MGIKTTWLNFAKKKKKRRRNTIKKLIMEREVSIAVSRKLQSVFGNYTANLIIKTIKLTEKVILIRLQTMGTFNKFT